MAKDRFKEFWKSEINKAKEVICAECGKKYEPSGGIAECPKCGSGEIED